MARFQDIDVIFCRNLLIYFDDMSRRAAAEAFFESMSRAGFICLGHAESMSRISSLFNVRRFGSTVIYQRPSKGGGAGMKKILVVDDATTVRMYHRRILAEGGFLVDECINGLEALEKCLLNRYDLVIVDINMPKMDGYRFLRELRLRRDVHQAPAIVVSTESEIKDRQAAYAAGANGYLCKPTKPDALLRVATLLTGGVS